MDGSQRRLNAVSENFSRSRRQRNQGVQRRRSNQTRVRRRRLAASIQSLEPRHLLTFAIDLFADINGLGVSSDIGEVVALGNESFFVADDGFTGRELWKTDGTTEGTTLVKDVLPGPDTSDPRELTVVGDELFFTAIDEEGNIDLWKSDGTEAGTTIVYDADANGVYYLSDLTESGGNLFFTAYEEASGYELWVSDGTAAGTMLVEDINPDQLVIDRPQELTDVNGTLFFTSYENGYYNRELWKTFDDGGTIGVMMVKDLGIDPGDDGLLGTADDDPSISSYPTFLTNVDGVLFFAAEDFEAGVELFKSDGTPGGTMMVSDLNPSGSSYPYELTAFNGEVFFAADDDTGERHVYRSDGNTISFVADTTGGLGSSNPVEFQVVGNDLFFSAEGHVPATTVSAAFPTMTSRNSRFSSSGYAGVISQATTPSGGILSGINGSGAPTSVSFNSTPQNSTNDGPGWAGPDPDPPDDPDPNSPERIGGGTDLDGNGTLDRLVPLRSIQPNDLYVEDIDSFDLVDDFWEWTISDPAGLTNISFAGFASGNEWDEATEGLHFQLFLNGSTTAAATHNVSGDDLDNWNATRDAANVNLSHPGTESGGPTITTATVRITVGDPTLPFTAFPDGGNEAFLINATLSADLDPATTLIDPAGRELHKIDAATMTATLVKDIVPMGSSEPTQLTEAGGKLFFAADDVLGDGLELWVSDGSEAGTMRVIDSLPGNDLYGAPLDGDPELFGAIGNQLLFTTTDSLRDRELWISDGTTLNTELVANINTGTADAGVRDLIPFANDIYFVANDGLNGEAIWKADTVAGTVEMVIDISPSSTDRISTLTVYNHFSEKIVFYNNSLGAAGGVYITDGDNPVLQISQRRPVELDEDGTVFVVVGEFIYFVTDDGVNGAELWKSDGQTEAVMVPGEPIPGSVSSNPMFLTAFGSNQLYFSAATNNTSATGNIGRELFYTDGEMIYLADDYYPGSNSSSPQHLTVSGETLFFSANNGTNGRELFTHDSTTPVADIRSGGTGSEPTNLTDIGGALYFSANNGSNGFEPYRVTGATGTPVQLGNINPGSASSNPASFFAALGDVYFAADDGTNGTELWKTDGTAGSATLVADIQPGPGSSDPVPLYDTGARLLLSASGNSNLDREFWSTDGASIMLMVEDLYPTEFFGSDPVELVEIDGILYFVADNGATNGRELFQLEQVAPAVSELIVGGDVGAPIVEVERSAVDLITIVFEGQVTVPGGAISLLNRDTNTAVTSLVVNSRFEDGQTFIELTFASGPSVIDRDPGGTSGLRNALADGNYQLDLASAGVFSPTSGATMDADYIFGTSDVDLFFSLFGDADGDRDVDVDDMAQMAMALGQTNVSSEYDEELDYDGDGDVDHRDFSQFRRRFQRSLNFS